MNYNKTTKIATHVLVWVLLFCFPYFLSSFGQQATLIRVMAYSWLPLTMYALIFYGNYSFLIDNFLFKNKKLMYVLINIVLIAVLYWFREIAHEYTMEHFLAIDKPPKEPKGEGGPPRGLFVYIQIISMLVPVVFSVGIKATQRWITIEAEKKEAENIKLSSELQHLKYQIQPHFFFNSLNNIYSLVDISPEQAKTTIHSLSKLMRYLLYDTNTEMISLLKEIEFIKKFISLMELRITDNTIVKSTFPNNNTDVKVAPLLFISLVENAFKHGVSSQYKSDISFEMTIDNNKIYFVTKNNNFPKEKNDKSGSGIGLQNLDKRLKLLYPNKHLFETRVENDLFIATLEIHL
ncbi:sensor histidine kinase [Wenyingzhuangia sp. IMCC45467]